MFVLTADQVQSRRREDGVPAATALLEARFGDALLLGPDRTAGDEFQVLTADPAAALGAVLALTRDGGWSAGLGVGPVAVPLPPTTREASGGAFVAARDAVERAKRSPVRFALTADGADAADAEALIGLLLALRARRSPAGWEVADLLGDGLDQSAAAARLGVTPQAVSARATAAGLRTEGRARPALTRLLTSLDAATVRR